MDSIVRFFCSVSVMILVASTLSFSAPVSSGGDNKSLTITVQVYSSRSDPTYQLRQESDELDQIKTLIDKSPRIEFKGKCIPSILGYHGILIDNPQKISGLPEHVLIYRGIIEIVGRTKEHRSDRDRMLEKFLIRQAKKAHVIDDDLLGQIGMNVSINDQ
ncbi:MAG TPA: hypothetical protein VHO84_13600 [Syntrophorhabdaceae bacterium]|nr:hypothetical protein [Syntrophorhabdaceae bacterium]